jgi:hypothetical protein
MNPVTARRRSPHRVDPRRRQGAGRGGAQPPTLFDGDPTGAAAWVAAGDRRSDVPAAAEPSDAAVPTVAAGSGETLDRLVVSSWERLVSRAAAPCLLCGGTMDPSFGAHATPVGGRCRDCGTTLA